MSSIGLTAKVLSALLNNQTPFSNFHPDYVEDKETDRNLRKLYCISRNAFYLQNTNAIEDNDTPINRNDVKAFYEMVLTLLTPEQISGLNYIPSFPSPSPVTVSDDAYNHVHRLHFAFQTWEPLLS
jgi:hypothetical protein